MKYLFTLTFCLIVHFSFAINYNAVNSGKFSSPSTWYNGIVPPLPLTGGEVINIYSNAVVTLDRDLTLSNTSTLNIAPTGKLQNSSTHQLQIGSGYLFGSGTIDIHKLIINQPSNISFTGSATVDELWLDNANVSAVATWNVKTLLKLTGGISMFTNGTVNISSGGSTTIIERDHGSIEIKGFASMPLSNSYHVRYRYPCDAGLELTGTGLTNVEVLAGDKQNVKLKTDVVINGMLLIDSSYFNLNYHDLTLADKGHVVSKNKGGVYSEVPSSMYVRTTLTNPGQLIVYGGSTTIPQFKNFVMDMQGSVGTLELLGGIHVADTLQMNKGHLQGAVVMAYGGVIDKGSNSSYIITPDNYGVYFTLESNTSSIVPLGTGKYYAPLKLTEKNNAGQIRLLVSLKDEILANGNTGTVVSGNLPCVQATWHINGGALSENKSVDAEVMWSAGMEVNRFADDACYLSDYDNSAWSWIPPAKANANGSLKTLVKTGIKKSTMLAVFGIDPTSVQSIDETKRLSVAPNPVTSRLAINHAGKGAAMVYDVTGRKVMSLALTEATQTIDVSALKKGIYFLKVKNDSDTVRVVQFLKQ